ncbi:MAG: FG-GAP repeat protein [Myxococcales bacterium]|nr:FG-GAP repeat protein [Myxococcales bacterium]
MSRTLTSLTALSTLTFAAVLVAPTVHAASDIDGDGFDDILIGARRADHTAAGGGVAAISLGSAAMAPGALLDPQVDVDARAGTAVAFGDFNCDGDVDYAMGAPLDASEEGRVYVYMSTANGHALETYYRANFSQEAADQAPGDHFGRALAVADFDGDGCDDLAIGAPKAASDGDHTGIVHVAKGQPSGLIRWRNLRPGITGEEKYGFSLTAGDLDDDGVPDLLISAPMADEGAIPKVGYVELRHFDQATDSFDGAGNRLSACDASAIGCNAADSERWFGWASAIGDFDGDGVTDVAVGRPGEEGQGWTGQVMVFDGASGHTSVELLALGGGSDLFGQALAAGDVDGDGSDDLVIGSPLTTLAGGPLETGAAFVVRDALTTVDVLSPEDVSTPTADKQKFGAAVALGNFYGGGLDLVVGASRAKDSGGVRSGGVYTFSNSAGTMSGFGMITLDAWVPAPNAGAIFGSAIAQ